MTQREIDALRVDDEFYFVRNTQKVSYHKCIVKNINIGTYGGAYTLTYRIKGANRAYDNIYRGNPDDGQIFIKKIDVLIQAKYMNRKLTVQMEEELARSFIKDAEYWI